MSALRDRLVVGGYRAGWAALRALPEPAARRLFDVGADLAVRRDGKGARRLRGNLARVTGRPPAELDDLVRAGMRSYARYWCEVFRQSTLSAAEVDARMSMANEHRLLGPREDGRGLVCVLGHLGNWDAAGAWFTSRGIRFTTVAERLEPAALFERFVAFRESLGMEVLPLTGGDRPPSEVLEERLRAGGVLCLLADRDLSAAGVPVQLFGSTASMPAGPAALALRTGALLVPVTLWFPADRPGGWAGHAHEPVPHTDVATMTQQVADVLATGIGEHPEDWHMLQRLWLDDLPPRPAA